MFAPSHNRRQNIFPPERNAPALHAPHQDAFACCFRRAEGYRACKKIAAALSVFALSVVASNDRGALDATKGMSPYQDEPDVHHIGIGGAGHEQVPGLLQEMVGVIIIQEIL